MTNSGSRPTYMGTKMMPKTKMGPKRVPKWDQHGPRNVTKGGTKRAPKGGPKVAQTGGQNGPRNISISGPGSGAFLKRDGPGNSTGALFLAPRLPRPGPGPGPKTVPKWDQNGPRNGTKTGPEMGPKRVPKWSQNGSQNGPRNCSNKSGSQKCSENGRWDTSRARDSTSAH